MQQIEARSSQLAEEREAAATRLKRTGAITGDMAEILRNEQAINDKYAEEAELLNDRRAKMEASYAVDEKNIKVRIEQVQGDEKLRHAAEMELENLNKLRDASRRALATREESRKANEMEARVENERLKVTAYELTATYRRAKAMHDISKAQEEFAKERGATPAEVGGFARQAAAEARIMLDEFTATYKSSLADLDRMITEARAPGGRGEGEAVRLENERYELMKRGVDLARLEYQTKLRGIKAEEEFRQEQISVQRNIFEVMRDFAARTGQSWRVQMGFQSKIIQAQREDLESARTVFAEMKAANVPAFELEKQRLIVIQKEAALGEAIIGKQRDFLEKAVAASFGMGGGTRAQPNINQRVFGPVVKNWLGQLQQGMPLTIAQQRQMMGGNIRGAVLGGGGGGGGLGVDAGTVRAMLAAGATKQAAGAAGTVADVVKKLTATGMKPEMAAAVGPGAVVGESVRAGMEGVRTSIDTGFGKTQQILTEQKGLLEQLAGCCAGGGMGKGGGGAGGGVPAGGGAPAPVAGVAPGSGLAPRTEWAPMKEYAPAGGAAGAAGGGAAGGGATKPVEAKPGVPAPLPAPPVKKPQAIPFGAPGMAAPAMTAPEPVVEAAPGAAAAAGGLSFDPGRTWRGIKNWFGFGEEEPTPKAVLPTTLEPLTKPVEAPFVGPPAPSPKEMRARQQQEIERKKEIEARQRRRRAAAAGKPPPEEEPPGAVAKREWEGEGGPQPPVAVPQQAKPARPKWLEEAVEKQRREDEQQPKIVQDFLRENKARVEARKQGRPQAGVQRGVGKPQVDAQREAQRQAILEANRERERERDVMLFAGQGPEAEQQNMIANQRQIEAERKAKQKETIAKAREWDANRTAKNSAQILAEKRAKQAEVAEEEHAQRMDDQREIDAGNARRAERERLESLRGEYARQQGQGGGVRYDEVSGPGPEPVPGGSKWAGETRPDLYREKIADIDRQLAALDQPAVGKGLRSVPATAPRGTGMDQGAIKAGPARPEMTPAELARLVGAGAAGPAGGMAARGAGRSGGGEAIDMGGKVNVDVTFNTEMFKAEVKDIAVRAVRKDNDYGA
jgi:hypothetical protein